MFKISSKEIVGRVWKFGNNLNTDVIIPTSAISSTSDPNELAKHTLEPIFPDFSKKVKPGDIIVAGKNFGYGSSREQASTVFKYLGVGAIVAESFARIFFRNSINLGLHVIICKDITRKVEQGEVLEVNPLTGDIKNLTTGVTFKSLPIPLFALEIIEDGGLIPHLKKRNVE